MSIPENKQLNAFLVQVFNDILRLEESSLAQGTHAGLSMTEIHVVEAVCSALEGTDGNSMSLIARRLGVTLGTLTVSVKTLERKGYLRRERATEDRRSVLVFPTHAGLSLNETHRCFHQKMVDGISQVLGPEELTVLAKALEKMRRYFFSIQPTQSRPSVKDGQEEK